MSSLPDGASRRWPTGLEALNRKLHYYLGLYFLFFLWLFSLTGLLLNHPLWRFGQFWPQREETKFEKAIAPISATSNLDRAQELMRQLGVTGEIDWPSREQDPGRLDFNVNRPGRMYRISADLEAARASVQQIDINAWGVMYVLHTFSGTRANNPGAERDWFLTKIWVVAMDALAGGLLLIVLSSYYMWFRLRGKRRLGLIALTAGVLSCGFFVAGLAGLR